MSPATTLQLFGASNCRQLLHFWSPLGLSWYFIACFEAFCCASASRATGRPEASEAPASRPANLRIERRERSRSSMRTIRVRGELAQNVTGADGGAFKAYGSLS